MKIIISTTKEMIDACLDFSTNIINQTNQFDRMSPSYATANIDLKNKIRIMRTFVGKLGELCFSVFLSENNIKHDVSKMFEIFEGETNVDELDFLTRDSGSIDIKTAVFSNHIRLVVPLDQFKSMPKDFYVGIKLNVESQENKYDTLDPYSIKSATIYGFCYYSELLNEPTINLGEYPCKTILLNKLHPIKTLLMLM